MDVVKTLIYVMIDFLKENLFRLKFTNFALSVSFFLISVHGTIGQRKRQGHDERDRLLDSKMEFYQISQRN